MQGDRLGASPDRLCKPEVGMSVLIDKGFGQRSNGRLLRNAEDATRKWCLRVPRRSRVPIPSNTVNWIRGIRRGHDLGDRARILASNSADLENDTVVRERPDTGEATA
jgi:hypothetical protein